MARSPASSRAAASRASQASRWRPRASTSSGGPSPSGHSSSSARPRARRIAARARSHSRKASSARRRVMGECRVSFPAGRARPRRIRCTAGSRRLVVIKRWQVGDSSDPERFFDGLRHGAYDWKDLERLVRGSGKLDPAAVVRRRVEAYDFRRGLTADERLPAADAKAQREAGLRAQLALSCRGSKPA